MRTIAVLSLAVAICGAARAGEPGRRVLDETAYWRYYVEFAPDRLDTPALKAEGGKLPGRDLKAVEKGVKRYFAPPFVQPGRAKDWAKADWRDEPLFFVSQRCNCGTDDERSWRQIHTPPPPAGWTRPDFDDGGWYRQRMPMLVGRLNLAISTQLHGNTTRQTAVRRACYRTTFEVPDPAKAGEYVLTAEFRGGLRVFVNGREIARAYLPKGKLDPRAGAEVYPREAYICAEGERPEKARKNVISKCGGIDACDELPAEFVAKPRRPRRRNDPPPDPNLMGRGKWGVGDVSIRRKGWRRIIALRDRRLEPLKVPAGVLRKGSNVLAVELRASNIHPAVAPYRRWQDGFYWSHCRLYALKLRSSSPSAPAVFARPAGVQVWGEDIHRRVFSADFGPARRAGSLRFVGAPGGTYAGQLVVGTDRRLTGLKVTAGDLKGEKGAVIPASALRIDHLKGHPVSEMISLGQGRNFPAHRVDPLCPPARAAVQRFGPPGARGGKLTRKQQLAAIEKLRFFDHVAEGVPGTVPADSCQPIWLSLSVPADAAAGTYRGSVTVRADGLKGVTVPVVAEVCGWRVPEARDFQTFMAVEQSPYGVARQYKVPLWSDEHFKRMEGSFRQMARVGANWLFVPVAANSEFGNRTDSMIRWIRKADGSWKFDYTRLDRYLKLAVRHLGAPRVISFVVMHGGDSYGGANPTAVQYLDEATGKAAMLSLRAEDDDTAPWKAFATSLYAHMQSLGLERSMYWGYGWDANGDPGLITLLARYVPSVKWTRGAHGLGDTGVNETFTAVSRIYGVQLPARSARGWRNKHVYLLMPRSGSSIMSCNGHSPPFTFRLMVDRAVVSGLSGIARLGADYWANSYFQGSKVPNYAVGMPAVQMLWPGSGGAESSVRFEVLREGIQETEARIFLEQALERKLLPAELARRVREALFDHNRATLFVSVGTVGVQTHEYSSGWQERSRRLYRLAAEAAGAVGFDVDKARVELDMPARGKTAVVLKLRNWTAGPSNWTARTSAGWIVPERASGTLPPGQQVLRVVLDSHKLPPNRAAKGTLTIADASGRSRKVDISVAVGGVLEFIVGEAYDFLGRPAHASAFGPKRVGDHAVFNVTVGGRQSREFTFANKTASKLTWRIASPAPWLRVEPASGTLGPLERAFVTITAAPPDKAAATHETILTVSESGGGGQKVRLITHVIPPYRRPTVPTGKAAPLSSLPNHKAVTLHKSRAYWWGSSSKRRDDYGPKYDEKGSIVAGVPQITICDIEGRGLAAFSAVAHIPLGYATAQAKKGKEALHRRLVSFEVHVDGKVRAQSGLMKSGDADRLLVVRGLGGAKRLKLIIRYDTPEPRNIGGRFAVNWLRPTLYK